METAAAAWRLCLVSVSERTHGTWWTRTLRISKCVACFGDAAHAGASYGTGGGASGPPSGAPPAGCVALFSGCSAAAAATVAAAAGASSCAADGGGNGPRGGPNTFFLLPPPPPGNEGALKLIWLDYSTLPPPLSHPSKDRVERCTVSRTLK